MSGFRVRKNIDVEGIGTLTCHAAVAVMDDGIVYMGEVQILEDSLPPFRLRRAMTKDDAAKIRSELEAEVRIQLQMQGGDDGVDGKLH